MKKDANFGGLFAKGSKKKRLLKLTATKTKKRELLRRVARGEGVH